MRALESGDVGRRAVLGDHDDPGRGGVISDGIAQDRGVCHRLVVADHSVPRGHILLDGVDGRFRFGTSGDSEPPPREVFSELISHLTLFDEKVDFTTHDRTLSFRVHRTLYNNPP